MSHEFQSTLYPTARAMCDAIAYEWMTAGGDNTSADIDEYAAQGAQFHAEECIEGWGLLRVVDDDTGACGVLDGAGAELGARVVGWGLVLGLQGFELGRVLSDDGLAARPLWRVARSAGRRGGQPRPARREQVGWPRRRSGSRSGTDCTERIACVRWPGRVSGQAWRRCCSSGRRAMPGRHGCRRKCRAGRRLGRVSRR
jgi:hypothetical protein